MDGGTTYYIGFTGKMSFYLGACWLSCGSKIPQLEGYLLKPWDENSKGEFDMGSKEGLWQPPEDH